MKLKSQHSKGIIAEKNVLQENLKNFYEKNDLNFNINNNKNNNYGLNETFKKLVNENNGEKLFNNLKNNNTSYLSNDSFDGYWVLMKDWSECSLKCDGGEQIKVMLCIPPKNEGKPCEGEAIQKRKCNQQPCPLEISVDSLFSENDNSQISASQSSKAIEKAYLKLNANYLYYGAISDYSNNLN